MFPSSIKWRLSLGASVITIGVIAIIGSLQIGLVRSDLTAGIADQQNAFVAHVARELDTKLGDHLNVLALSARQLPAASFVEPAAFVDRYRERPGMLTLFDSLTLIRTDGEAIATFPENGLPIRGNFADRRYFRDVVASGRPVISEPLRSRVDGEPVVVMAAPVFAADGTVAGVVAAVLHLQRPNLLGNLAHERVGKAGYFFVLTRGDHPVYVVHPDPARILAERPPTGTVSTARALAGFEGTVEDVNSSGVHALFSYVTLKSTGWVLAALLPTDEAFAPIANGARRVVFMAVLAALLVAPLAWFVAWRLLTPLSRLSDAVGRTDGSPEDWHDIALQTTDEVSTLTQSFNSLMRRLKTAQSELKASEQWLRSITDNLPALICYIDRDHRFRFNNRTYERWLQMPVADITGKRVADIYGAEVYARLAPSIDEALAGEPTKFEVGFAGRDGTEHCARGRYVPHADEHGNVLGVFGLVTDETRLKYAEVARMESEKRLLDITNNVPAVIGQFDMQERCLFANDIGLKVHGIKRAQMATLTFGSHIDADLYAQHATALREVLAGKSSIARGHRTYAGRKVWFEAHLVPDFDGDGRQRGFFVMSFDVTTIKTAELARARSEQRVRDIANNLPVLVCHIDRDQRLTFCNDAFRSTVDRNTGEPIGRSIAEVLGAELHAQVAPYIRRGLDGERLEFELNSPVHGENRHHQVTYVPDVQGGVVVGLTGLSVDVTALKNAQRRLSRLAHFDALTQMPNRLQFNDALDAAFERDAASDGSIALMFLDIDHFKDINDTHGHAIGDAVLVQFAERLRSSVRATDLCARLAGDEFVVLLDRLTTSEQARQLARKVVARIDQPFRVGSQTLRVTASLGVAFRDASVASAGELLARADQALYEAKASGRNTFRLVA